MKATVLLTDAAQVDAQGKVHALGMGWSQTVTPTPSQTVVIIFEIAWDESDRKIPMRAALVDADGGPVTITGPMGEQPIVVEGELESGRAPGVPRGTPTSMAIAVPVPPGLHLVVGQRYEWRVTLDGDSNSDWTAGFLVTAEQGSVPT